MQNSEKYRFKDFTSDNYRRLLKIAKDKFVFKNYTNYSNSENFVLWRHDVDFSMHRALKLAEIEAEEGVNSTFFILLHSNFYNLMEEEISHLLRKIIDLGHDVGLHFDSHFYKISNENELDEKLIFEKNIIEYLYGIDVKSFCFHITNDFTLQCHKSHYAGLINAFSLEFQKNVPYCSDSNGYWRFSTLEEVLNSQEIKKLQVNTHPSLWQDEIMSPKQRVYRCAEIRAEKTKACYDSLLKQYKRENIDW